MSRSRRIAARVALVVGSLALSLGGAELVYRMRASQAPDGGDDGWYQRYRHMNETIYQRSSDPVLVYEPVASSSVEMEYGSAGFNAARLREENEVSPMPDERTRVVLLGDSLVWGEYLAVHETMAQRTQDALGDAYQVLNAGVTGYDTVQEARWYEVAVRPLHPRVLVLVFCMNDLMIMSGPYGRFASEPALALKDAQDAMFAARAPLRRETLDDVIDRRERDANVRILARAWGMWERWRFESAYVDEYLIVADDDARWRRVGEALSRLGDAVRADGALPILVISPVLERWEDYRWAELHRRIGDTAHAAGWVAIDPLDTMRREHTADEMRMGSDNLHYGRTGSRVMGEILAHAIESSVASEE